MGGFSYLSRNLANIKPKIGPNLLSMAGARDPSAIRPRMLEELL
jgi:hypothetical protein